MANSMESHLKWTIANIFDLSKVYKMEGFCFYAPYQRKKQRWSLSWISSGCAIRLTSFFSDLLLVNRPFSVNEYDKINVFELLSIRNIAKTNSHLDVCLSSLIRHVALCTLLPGTENPLKTITMSTVFDHDVRMHMKCFIRHPCFIYTQGKKQTKV